MVEDDCWHWPLASRSISACVQEPAHAYPWEKSDGQTMFLKSVKSDIGYESTWLYSSLGSHLIFIMCIHVGLLKLNNQWWSWGDGSATEMLPEWVWGPESDPQHLCTDVSCSGAQTQSPCWHGRSGTSLGLADQLFQNLVWSRFRETLCQKVRWKTRQGSTLL